MTRVTIVALAETARQLGINIREVYNNIKIYLENEGFLNVRVYTRRRSGKYNITFFSTNGDEYINGVNIDDDDSDVVLVDREEIFGLFDQGMANVPTRF